MATLDHQAIGETENVRAMALALDWAWEALPEDLDRSDATRRDLATLIVDHFLQGERDSSRLCDWVLSTIDPSEATQPN